MSLIGIERAEAKTVAICTNEVEDHYTYDDVVHVYLSTYLNTILLKFKTLPSIDRASVVSRAHIVLNSLLFVAIHDRHTSPHHNTASLDLRTTPRSISSTDRHNHLRIQRGACLRCRVSPPFPHLHIAMQLRLQP
jgi:hypothetical protein